MKLKAKLSAFIFMFALVMCILVVGVWAVKSTNFQVGGNINFTATGINATISAGTLSSTGTLTNTDASNKMKEVKITTAKTSSQIEEEFKSWQGLALEFNEAGDDVTITFTITNDGTGAEDFVYVKVDISASSLNNATATINTKKATLNPKGQEGSSQQFVITFSVTEKTVDASISDFVINFEMSNTAPSILKYDEDNNYYYVEMGTYNDAPVRWRYLSANGETKFDPSSGAPSTTTGSKGWFMLETYTATAHIFDNNSNDYATSDVRSFLVSTDDNSFMKKLSISTEDNIYTKIQGIPISDLYKEINWQLFDQGQVTDGTTTSTGSDKFWLPSVKEMYTLVGGGSVSNNIIANDAFVEFADLFMWRSSESDEYGVSYWSRSPWPECTDTAFYLSTDDRDLNTYGVDHEFYVRPMFCLTF